MNLYLIGRPDNVGYDQFSSAVVVAESADEARNIHPRYGLEESHLRDYSYEWVEPSEVLVTYLGNADPRNPSFYVGKVVCASYHAG